MRHGWRSSVVNRVELASYISAACRRSARQKSCTCLCRYGTMVADNAAPRAAHL